MSASEEAVSGDTGATSMGPGERLQAARIKQGLSVEDVANRMHLSTGILEALEENNFEEITAPIFVKGYLRAYARIVSLDEEEMIGLYTEYHRDEDPPISTINNVGSELTAADARIRWTTYLVVLVLLTLLGAWWWNRQNTESTPISLDSQVEEETRAGIVEPEPEPVIEAVSASVDPPRPSIEPTSGTPASGGDAGESPSLDGEALAGASPGEPAAAAGEFAEPSVGSADEPLARIESAAQPAAPAEVETAGLATSEPGVAPVETAASSAIAEEPAPPTAAVASRLPAVIAPSGSDRLTLVVNADTWADIKDDSGFRLVYDLLRSGSSVELTGEAPFAVFLGNGHGVELQYNGENVDISADIRDNNTARLSIGE